MGRSHRGRPPAVSPRQILPARTRYSDALDLQGVGVNQIECGSAAGWNKYFAQAGVVLHIAKFNSSLSTWYGNHGCAQARRIETP